MDKAANISHELMSYKKILAVLITLSLLAVIAFHFINSDETKVKSGILEEVNTENIEEIHDEKQKEGEVEKVLIAADIKGAVKKPGLYYIEPGARVLGLIEKAGGFLEDADQTQINLAEIIQDEMMIYVPLKGEVKKEDIGVPGSGHSNGRISLNKATIEELQQLPGIGPGKAKLIIEYRQESGMFKKLEDLKNVSGIGDKTYEKIADLISL
ncbi:competence protein ComEA [Falsibacillus pallidus]|uniref:Competence protein ComEA n=2 Tax=Falsibacillus pallidus TaxID=493781 RepID=A0A370GQ01_9BACI|nr:competence protein ComEA [Falsibacillus pallidus]